MRDSTKVGEMIGPSGAESTADSLRQGGLASTKITSREDHISCARAAGPAALPAATIASPVGTLIANGSGLVKITPCANRTIDARSRGAARRQVKSGNSARCK